jgi:hypothetical protein
MRLIANEVRHEILLTRRRRFRAVRHAVDVGLGVVELSAIGEPDIRGVGRRLAEQADPEFVRDIGEHFELCFDAAVLLGMLPALRRSCRLTLVDQ